MSDDIEAIRQRRLEELQGRMTQEADQQRQVQEKIAQIESMVRPKLDKKALERYGNLRTVHPELAVQALLVLAQMSKTHITDEQFKEVLVMLQPPKRETKIIRK